MREIVLDTETTGLDPNEGHRVVEIGAVELVNHIPTGRVYQEYINPERDMPAEAEQVHGLSEAFLRDKPVFSAIAESFLMFLDTDGHGEPSPGTLVIHNAAFDMKFLNSELTHLGHAAIGHDRVIDTLHLARQRFPGAPANLDALCRRFDVDTSARTKHGALLDSELLAEVYLGLIGGRQPGLDLAIQGRGKKAEVTRERAHRPPRPHAPSAAELEAHQAFLQQIKDPLWSR
ncbi:MAG: DNA polymerase III subunit epsilon [Alphaproteobacteria bacterium]|nr:DNA polymerase III subunit epsilon [Alphaproteobacteria bacterium]